MAQSRPVIAKQFEAIINKKSLAMIGCSNTGFRLFAFKPDSASAFQENILIIKTRSKKEQYLVPQHVFEKGDNIVIRGILVSDLQKLSEVDLDAEVAIFRDYNEDARALSADKSLCPLTLLSVEISYKQSMPKLKHAEIIGELALLTYDFFKDSAYVWRYNIATQSAWLANVSAEDVTKVAAYFKDQKIAGHQEIIESKTAEKGEPVLLIKNITLEKLRTHQPYQKQTPSPQ